MKLIGGFHLATDDTAVVSLTTAFDRSGTEPWPAVPRAVSVMARGIFSSVWIDAKVTLPPWRLRLPPSARQNSASIFGEVLVWPCNCDAEAHRAFFAGLEERDDVAVERHVLALQRQQRHDRGRDVVLVVDGAAAVDVAVLAQRAERGMGPLLGVDVHRVGVRHQQQRPLLARALEPRDQVGPVRLEREGLGGDALLLEHRCAGSRRPAFPRPAAWSAGRWSRSGRSPGSASGSRRRRRSSRCRRAPVPTGRRGRAPRTRAMTVVACAGW